MDQSIDKCIVRLKYLLKRTMFFVVEYFIVTLPNRYDNYGCRYRERHPMVSILERLSYETKTQCQLPKEKVLSKWQCSMWMTEFVNDDYFLCKWKKCKSIVKSWHHHMSSRNLCNTFPHSNELWYFR